MTIEHEMQHAVQLVDRLGRFCGTEGQERDKERVVQQGVDGALTPASVSWARPSQRGTHIMGIVTWPDCTWPSLPPDPPAPPHVPPPSERLDEAPVSHPDPSVPQKRPTKTALMITSCSPDMPPLMHEKSASPCVSPVTAFRLQGVIFGRLC